MAAPSTVQVFNYLRDQTGAALANATVHCVLDYSQATVTATGDAVLDVQQTTTTDSTGKYTFTVVPNDLLSPANTTYTIVEPHRSYQIAPQSANGASQQTTAVNVIVNAPGALAAATSGLTGPITVTGNETVTGTLTVGGVVTNQSTVTNQGAVTNQATTDTVGAATFDAILKIKGPDPFVMLDYYAVGDGVADDTTAINNALAALPTGGGLLIGGPGKTYKFTSGITWNKHVHFIGAGRDLDNTSSPPTVFSYQPAGTGTTAMTITVHGCVFEGFLLVQGNAQGTTNGFTGSGAFSSSVRDVTVMSFTGNGISLLATGSASCLEWSFDQVRSASNNVGLLLQGNAGAGKSCNSNTFKACQFVNNTTNNLIVQILASDNVFMGCDLTGQGTITCVRVGDGSGGAGTVRGNAFFNCDCENGSVGFRLDVDTQMTWIHANVTSTTKVTAVSVAATYFFVDTHGGSIASTIDTGARHLLPSGGAAPTLGALAANISSQNFVGTPSDARGTVTITLSGNISAGGVVCTVNFGASYPATPFIAVTTSNGQGVSFGVTSKTASLFNIYAVTALTSGQTYTIDFLVLG